MRTNGRPIRIVLAVLVALTGAACSASPPSASAPPAAASYEEYRIAACAAWDALFRAVGNPDTASGSDLSRALDAAMTAGDVASADRLAMDIARELKTGRDQIAVAGGWSPRAPVMVQPDRVFAAFEAMIAAERARPGTSRTQWIADCLRASRRRRCVVRHVRGRSQGRCGYRRSERAAVRERARHALAESLRRHKGCRERDGRLAVRPSHDERIATACRGGAHARLPTARLVSSRLYRRERTGWRMGPQSGQ